MILLVTPSERAGECAAALHEATGEAITVSAGLARATTLLRADSYLAVVLDQYLLETAPDEAASTLQHVGTAIPVQVNLAISGLDRLVREVRTALERREREEARATQAAMAKVHSELSSTVTALLLSTELACDSKGLPPAAAEKMDSVLQLVKKLRRQLENASSTEEAEKAVGA